MDPYRSAKPIKKGTGPLGVCPYLGVQNDPATHFAWAKPGHFCYRVRPPQAITSSHQDDFCLNGKYPACVVYAASWKGGLPNGIRDDAHGERSRRVPAVKSPSPPPVEIKKVTESATSRFGMDLSSLRDTGDFVEVEREVSPPWWKRRAGKVVISAVVLLPLLLLSAWAMLRITRPLVGTTAMGPVDPSLAADLTATWQYLQAGIVTQTSTPLPPTPTSTSTSAPTATNFPTPTAIPSTPTPLIGMAVNLSPTQPESPSSSPTPVPVSCEEKEAYSFELLEGPRLNPALGTTYVSGLTPTNISSSWLINNNSGCIWDSVLLFSVANNRLLLPFIRLGDEVIYPVSADQDLNVLPGGTIEVGLSFPLYLGRGIRGEWALVVNGHRLLEFPHMQLDVTNWVIGYSSGATPVNVDSPPSESRSDPGPGRPTEAPPSIRP